MGCIFACLRFKDNKKRNKAQLKSSPVPSKTKEPLLSEDHFVSVFISEGSPCEQIADLHFQDNHDQEILERELRDEVKFLKSCGAILETPAELRKASEKLQPSNKDITFSSSPCPSGTSIKKLVWEEPEEDSESVQNSAAGSNSGEHQAQRHDDSASHTSSFTQKLVLDEQEDSKFEHHSSSGFIFGLHQTQKHNDTSASLIKSAHLEKDSESAVILVSPSRDDTKVSDCFVNVEYDPELESVAESTAVLDISPSQDDTRIQVFSSKDVCLESVTSNPGIERGIASSMLDDSPSQGGTQIQASGAKNSPYPTPLMLTDEMETPCTVYPSTRDSIRKKYARVRTQFVYPILNPVESLTQLKVQQTPVALSSDNQNDKRSPNRDEFDKENYSSAKRLRSLTPLSYSRWKVTSSSENPQVEVLSLSKWLKHPPQDDKKRNSCLDRTPDVERLIFGFVAFHRNEDDHHDSLEVSPKCWGGIGNGIPNTTTKYKEDQKVSWHATPFEERLDKALLDDNHFP